jgi:DNA mismatch repair protein MutS2
VVEGSEPHELEAERKISDLDRKAKKFKLKEKAESTEEPAKKEKPLKIGDAVRMIETMAAGEVIEIKGKMVLVESGSYRFRVSHEKIERISRAELKKSLKSAQSVRETDPAIYMRKLNFNPEIDIRGVRGEEAINRVRDLIDNALMVQHRNLRILHGKGNGILRQLVRDYLATVDVVKSFRDEHVELGGSGITVVEMDF